MRRKCTHCNTEKEPTEFHKQKATNDNRSECKECTRKRGALHKTDKYHNGGVKEQISLAKDFINWIATEQGCQDCNDAYKDMPEFLKIVNGGFLQHPESLSYDHVLGEKKFAISSWKGYALTSSLETQQVVIKRFQDELKKCEIVCHNCHAIRTRKDWYKYHQASIARKAIEREKLING